MHRKYFLLCLLFAIIFSACSRSQSPTPPQTVEITLQSPTASPGFTPEPSSTQTGTKPPEGTPSPSPEKTAPVFAVPRSLMGIQVHQMSDPEQSALFQESGATWSRHHYFLWNQIEPEHSNPPTYLWDEVNETEVTTAIENGGVTIAVVQLAPDWAQKYPGNACGPIAEDAFDDFAAFMREVVSRYSQPPYNQKYWEIWNEQDVDHTLVGGDSLYGCWGEIGDPYYGGQYYGEMLKIVYPAIKAADPEARVLVGGLLLDCDPVNPPETAPGSGLLKDCTASRFLEGILEAGGGDYFDGVSFHAYDYYYGELGMFGNAGWHSASNVNGPALLAKSRYLKSLLLSQGYTDKELLNTEVAVLCGRDGKEDFCLTEDFAKTKAYYIAQAYASALAEGLRANVWYSLTGWRGSGLVDRQRKPEPAFSAYQFAAKQLDRSVFFEPVREYEGVMGYKFKQEGKAIWVLWSLDQQTHRITLPVAYQAAYDVFGDPLADTGASKKELPITLAPVYIEWID